MKSFVIPEGGGVVSFVNQLTGEVREIPVPAGVHPLARYARYRLPNEELCTPGPRLDGQHFIATLGNMRTIQHEGHEDSAANPSFRVTPAQRQAKQMQGLLARSEALNRSAMKAMQAVKRAKRDVPKIEHKPEIPAASDAGEVSAT